MNDDELTRAVAKRLGIKPHEYNRISDSLDEWRSGLFEEDRQRADFLAAHIDVLGSENKRLTKALERTNPKPAPDRVPWWRRILRLA